VATSVGAAVHSDRALDQRAEHLLVDVVEAPEVDTALSDLMRTWLRSNLGAKSVYGQCGRRHRDARVA
jgi:hypothetical protein